MKINVQDSSGKVVESIKLDTNIFNIKVNSSVVRQAVLSELSNLRQGTHSSKNRSAVRGGGKKPWKQKGRGVARAGTIKKYSFSTQRKTHGQGDTHRHVGSIGAASDPSRVFPGKKMPGRYGNKIVSLKNLEVISVNEPKNQLLVKGSVPGATNGIVYVTR